MVRKGYGVEGKRAIHATRFLLNNGIKDNKNKLAFNKKTSSELVLAAQSHLQEAKKVHDEIEKYYKVAMDYDKLNCITDEFISRIK